MTNKIAVITGTSSGFGFLSALEMARQNFKVVATMRDLGRRESLDKAAVAAGVDFGIDVRRLDVTEFASLPGFIEGVLRDHGRVDVLVNNAGFAVAGFVEDLKLEEIRLQFETNFFGTVALTKAVLPAMRAQRSGHIIMVSSVSGLHGSPIVSSYSASKHALEGWSESLRLEVRSLGIKVALVEPGSYETDIWTRNAHLGERVSDPNSPNLARSQRLREAVRKLKKRDPIEVARLIARIAQDPNPRLRYLIGTDAQVQMLFKNILPWKWHEKLLSRALGLDQA
ncbi:MAG TPA: SDR family oxidoreductase [Terriglobales bacterium]|nr:SDR family oxidoreductase [Terriglobales bacterium]